MTYEQLMTFRLVADEKNFSRVANLLQISATAVGKQIKALEEQIGIQLLYRTTRHVALTEFGHIFYNQVLQILNETDKAEALVSSYQGKACGKLKIISGVYFGEYHIVPHIPAFMALYPNIIVSLELSERIPDLEKEDIDIAIGLQAGVFPEHYMCRRLFEDRHVCCASPRYLKKYGQPKKPIDLERHLIITHSGRPHPTVFQFANTTVPVRPSLWLNNISAILECCKAGAGIALLPKSVAETTIQSKKLTEILTAYKKPADAVYLNFKKMAFVQPKLRVFIDFITSKVKQNSKEDESI